MTRTPFIVLFCGNHRYCFIYEKGREEELISAMRDYARDDRFNFGWPEFKSIMMHMQKQLADSSEPDKYPL